MSADQNMPERHCLKVCDQYSIVPLRESCLNMLIPVLLFLPLQKPAVLFYLGFKPFKEYVMVENKQILGSEDLPQTLPELRSGNFHYFHCIREGEEELYIYIFKFNEVKGCRTIHADFHGELPPCLETNKMSDAKLLSYKGPAEFGTSYFYTSGQPEIEYTETGGYIIKAEPSTSVNFGDFSEYARRDLYKECLENHIKEHSNNLQLITTTHLKLLLNTQKISPFSGGGDDMLIGMLIGIPPEGLVVSREDQDEDSVYSPITNQTVANIEYKDVTLQSNQALESQLEANMMMLASQILALRLKRLKNDEKPITKLRELNTVSSYGISFGLLKPIVIKKLTLNFQCRCVELQKRYESAKDLDKAPRLACATQYLLKQMERQTPDPEPQLQVE